MLEECLHLDVSYSFQSDEWLMISLAKGEVISDIVKLQRVCCVIHVLQSTSLLI